MVLVRGSWIIQMMGGGVGVGGDYRSERLEENDYRCSPQATSPYTCNSNPQCSKPGDNNVLTAQDS